MLLNDLSTRRWGVVALAALGLVCFLSAPSVTAGTAREGSAFEWTGVPRVVAIGDVHGVHGDVLSLLSELGLIDENLSWSGCTDHLVFVGDLLDRGAEERPLVDLVRRLQAEAGAAGGRVHLLLGNHEAMNLVRDFRYVSPEGFAAFADLEDPGDRKRAWDRYRAEKGGAGSSANSLRRAFDQARPPGYFGRARALGAGGEYGNWILAQPTIIKVNKLLFVHAGLTEKVAGLGIDEINRIVRAELQDFAAQRTILEENDGVARFATFTEVMQAADEYGPPNGAGRTLAGYRAATGLLAFLQSIVVDPDGPLWYRGNSLEDERIERARLAYSLHTLDAETMVIGHSITRSGLVHSRFEGKLYRTDIGLVGGGRPQALVFEDGGVRVFDAASDSFGPVVVEPPPGEHRFQASREMPDGRAEAFLKTAEIREERPLGRGRTRPLLLTLKQNGETLRALFKRVQTPRKADDPQAVTDRYQHEVAAYRLDRMLGFGLVPVTVARSFNARGTGSLQLWIESAVDDQGARYYSLPEVHASRVSAQRTRAVVFDALIGNPIRRDTDILHLPLEGRILLVDHSEAFSTVRRIEPYLPQEGCLLDGKAKRVLEALTRKGLQERLGPFLDKDQIRSILARRDLLLESCRREPRQIW